jgi:hypothetical protein
VGAEMTKDFGSNETVRDDSELGLQEEKAVS